MIVKKGREYIIENGFNTNSITKIIFGDSDAVSKEEDVDISSLKLTESSTIISTVDVSEEEPYKYYYYNKDDDGNDITVDSDGKPIDPKKTNKPCEFKVTKNENTFLFKIKLYRCEATKAETPTKISCMGLFNNNTLIARVVFPPIYKKNNTELDLEYTLYF